MRACVCVYHRDPVFAVLKPIPELGNRKSFKPKRKWRWENSAVFQCCLYSQSTLYNPLKVGWLSLEATLICIYILCIGTPPLLTLFGYEIRKTCELGKNIFVNIYVYIMVVNTHDRRRLTRRAMWGLQAYRVLLVLSGQSSPKWNRSRDRCIQRFTVGEDFEAV